MPHRVARLLRTDDVSPVRVFVLLLVVVFAVEAVIMLLLPSAPRTPEGSILISLVDSVSLVAVLCPVLWLVVVRPLQKLVAQRGKLLQSTLLVQEQERARIARDLHDELGQAQTAVLLALRSVMNAPDLASARERADAAHSMAADAMESGRRLARGLSPAVLSDFGLQVAVERICEDLAAASGIVIAKDLELGTLRFEPPIEIAVYRVIQEALTNAVKHAAAATIGVELSYAGGRVIFAVSDDGQGMNFLSNQGSGQGLGLPGMQERIVLLGGGFRVGPSHAGGTTVSASLPATPRSP